MTIIVTGGTKGIGFAIAERLARPGANLLLVYREDDAAATAATARLQASGAKITLVRANVGAIDGAATVMEAAAALGPGPVQLVHSAAAIYPTTLLDADLDLFTRAIEVNGLSLLYLVQKGSPLLTRGSAIVFISSAGARSVMANYAALGAGKALAESLMRYLVPELAPRGVRINAVAPGLVATSSVARMVGGEDAAARLLERAARANPSGRLSRDGDYAGVVEFLLGPDAEFVQGQVVHANGGAFIAS